MELRHLRYFVAVAEEKHFGRAAHKLHMAQPPLSQQIKQLEDELGVQLLSRTTRRVDLTPAGEAYVVRARAILQAVDTAAHEAARIGRGLEGRLVVGCVGSATYSLLPALARALREQLPDVDFAFRGEMLSPDQLTALRAGTIDLALLRTWGDVAQDPDIRLIALRQEKYVVALPEGHRLAGRAKVRMSDLRDEDFIVHSTGGRSAMFEAVTDLCRQAGFEPTVRHEVDETSTLVTFVAAALGVAVVPEPVQHLGVAGTAYRPLATRARTELVAATRLDDESPLLARTLHVLTDEIVRESPPW